MLRMMNAADEYTASINPIVRLMKRASVQEIAPPQVLSDTRTIECRRIEFCFEVCPSQNKASIAFLNITRC